ncbi:hypothetical protein CYMTET_50155 [Cymbomonas tetramitiformis]|uniref:Uncharacterized protein n=1 Tax=Cymbomonas tetramitiformis TaxID=36881 RepID=A0AAE0BNT2_9CHLO|nr:hypothetical protein CYMTET_50155 [Cymbomonas tetramitiformis]
MSCKDTVLGIASDLWNGQYQDALEKLEEGRSSFTSLFECFTSASSSDQTLNGIAKDAKNDRAEEVEDLDTTAAPEMDEEGEKGEEQVERQDTFEFKNGKEDGDEEVRADAMTVVPSDVELTENNKVQSGELTGI